jgi:hypothetical protein
MSLPISGYVREKCSAAAAEKMNQLVFRACLHLMLKRRFALMLHDVCLPPRCAKKSPFMSAMGREFFPAFAF